MSRKPPLIPNPHAPAPTVRKLEPALGGRTVRRRDFLNGMLIGASGLVAGGGLAGCDGGKTETEPDPLPPGKDAGDANTICHQVRDGKMWEIPAVAGDLYDCVIIGGGLAGLCTAYRLQKLGITNLLILEKEDPAGGYARLDGPAASPWGQASAYTVFPYNDNLIELYTDLGVVTGLDADELPILDDKFVLKEPVNNSYIGGKWYAEPWDKGIGGLPYTDQVKADLEAFRDDMIYWYEYADPMGNYAFDTPTDASTEEAEVRALDDITFAEYIAQKGWGTEVTDFYRPYCRSAFGSEPETLSCWAALNFFGSEFQPSMSQPGGNAHLALKLAEIVGAASIQTGCFVLRAKNEGAEVHVSYLKGEAVQTIRAKTAVYAGPRYLAKYVLPDLVAAGRDEAKDFQYTPYLVAAVHVEKTPADLGYDNWIQDEETLFTDIIVADWSGLADPAGASLDRANTLSLYCPLIGDGKRAELLSKPFEEYEQQILDDLEKVLPGVRDTVTGVDIYRWGHAMLAPGKGFMFSASRVGSQLPEGLISFANHDVDGLPAFENAVGAAFRAADEVLAVVMGGGPPP
jgi:protoporphyrinogen oxidase